MVSHGELAGGLIIERGAQVVIFGHVRRNIVNHGKLVLNANVSGKIIGDGTYVIGPTAQVGGDDLPVEIASTDEAI